jgi:hypothetical protein
MASTRAGTRTAARQRVCWHARSMHSALHRCTRITWWPACQPQSPVMLATGRSPEALSRARGTCSQSSSGAPHSARSACVTACIPTPTAPVSRAPLVDGHHRLRRDRAGCGVLNDEAAPQAIHILRAGGISGAAATRTGSVSSHSTMHSGSAARKARARWCTHLRLVVAVPPVGALGVRDKVVDVGLCRMCGRRARGVHVVAAASAAQSRNTHTPRRGHSTQAPSAASAALTSGLHAALCHRVHAVHDVGLDLRVGTTRTQAQA